MKKITPHTILITGVSGYWGQSLLRYLSEINFSGRVIGIDIKKPQKKYPFLDFHKMDIRDERLCTIMTENKINTVVHLAFALNIFSPDSKIRDVNINGTKNLLDCSVRSNIKKFILASSTTVYGAFPDNPLLLTENAHLRRNKDFFYTRDKIDIENMVKAYQHKHAKVKFVIIRPAVITGRSMGNILTFFIRLLRFIPAPSGCDAPVQFIHEHDLARATYVLIANPCEGIYNVAGEGGVKFSDIIRMCGRRTLPIPRRIMKKTAAHLQKIGLAAPFAGVVDFISYPWVVSSAKLTEEFNFHFKYTSTEAFEEFARSLRNL
ncbi:MAG: NAD-dependent epimerase/dehydratase family protein [bacterium]